MYARSTSVSNAGGLGGCGDTAPDLETGDLSPRVVMIPRENENRGLGAVALKFGR
jgi:hypothetical protein